MRYLLLTAVTLFFLTTSHAQFNLFVQGGANYADFRIKGAGPSVQGKGNFGWQVGVGSEYYVHYGNYFLGFGAGVAQRNWQRESATVPDTILKNQYNPIFITVPIRIGWQIPVINDNIAFKLYAGLTPEIGVGGRIKQTQKFYKFTDSGSSNIVLAENELGKRNITWGYRSTKRVDRDLRRTNWQLNLTAGLCFANRTEVNVSYNYGITSILPDPAQGEVDKLSFVDANVKFYLFQPKINKRTR